MNGKWIKLIEESDKILKGKREKVRLVLCNILAGGHTLIEDDPGVGKTTLAKYFGKALNMSLSRIQFTNDLLPSDIIGTMIFDRKTSEFLFNKGPIFGELILADELNRAPPKTQSALLQAMEEKTISIESQNFELSDHFSVIATQNPNLQVGTFDLPESQIDRFSMKLKMGYASEQDTISLLKGRAPQEAISELEPFVNIDDLSQAKKIIREIDIEDSVYSLVYKILETSRESNEFTALSNRCGLDIISTARAWAFLKNRDYVIPDDIIELLPFTAGHRLVSPGTSNNRQEHQKAKSIISQI